MKPTIKQLQDTIKSKDTLIKGYELWMKILGKAINRGVKREDKLRARIKVLNKALVAAEKDYQALKRTRKKK